MTPRDRIIARYKEASDHDDYDPADAHSDATSAVEPDEDDLLKMIEAGIKEGCDKVHSKEERISNRWMAMSEWKEVEFTRSRKKLKVTFPYTIIAFTGGNPNDDSDREGDQPIFEITVERIDR